MRIEAVSMSHFKSLRDVKLDLSEFTVITGPNGAGKSNLVDGVNFLGEVYAVGLEQAVARNGGLVNMMHVHADTPPQPLSFKIRAVLGSEDVASFEQKSPTGPWSSDLIASFGLVFEHTFSMSLPDQELGSDFEIISDEIEFSDPAGRLLVRVGFGVHNSSASDIEVLHYKPRLHLARMTRDILGPLAGESLGDYIPARENLRSSLLLESLNIGQAVPYIKRAISGMRLFQLSPYQCRRPSVATPNAMLDRYGDNLPAAAVHLERRDPGAWALVQSSMESIVPGLEKIDFVYTEDRRLSIRFLEHGAPRAWTADEVSDGTIQALALMVALWDRRSPVLMVEEPENSLHPWILRQFIDFSRSVTEKQIVLTTHSPVVLDYVPGTSVRLMYSIGGVSRLERLLDADKAIRQLVEAGEIGVFDVYDSGMVSRSVPAGLAKETDDG